MSDLLKNAVADAKMVKDTALANAQIVLAEAFTPQLQSMLSKKLQSEIEELEEEFDAEDEFDADEEEVDESVELEEEANSEDLDETKAEDGEVVNEEELDEEDASAVNEMDDEEDMEDFEDEEGEDDGLDLDEIIAELEAYLEADDAEEDEDGEVDLDGDGDVDVAFDDEGGEDEVDFEDDEEDEEDFDLDEILSALEEMEQAEEIDEQSEELERLRAENEALRGDLTEHRDVVVFLRDKINEVNLLNAKLLYSNKLFRAFNMDNNQKKRVLEALDRTKDVREVKLVYATLAENMSHGTISKRTTVTEGLASKTVKSTKPTKEVIEESVEITDAEKTFNRLQELAFKKRR